MTEDADLCSVCGVDLAWTDDPPGWLMCSECQAEVFEEGLQALRDYGPFETELAASMASGAHEQMNTEHRAGVRAEENSRVLEEAVDTAGIGVGKLDRKVLEWLTGWEPCTANAIAGMILRAYLSGGQETDL